MNEISVSDPQACILESTCQRNLFLAGAGSGKTHCMGLLSADFVINYPQAIGLIATNTYSQLSKSTIKGIFDCWHKTFGWVNGTEYVVDKIPPDNFKTIGQRLKSYENTISFSNGALIFTASLDNYKVLDGMEIGYALLDETKDTREEAVTEVIVWRLRQKAMWLHEGAIYEYPIGIGYNPLFIFTSPAKVYWLNDWFELSDKYEEISQKIFSKTDFFQYENNGVKVVISSTWHNSDNLPEGFIESKLKDFAGNQDKIDMLIYGSPIAKSGGELFSGFSRLKHVKDNIHFSDNTPIHVSFDFNVAPYITCLIAQIIYAEEKYIVKIIDELCLDNPKNNTEALCNNLTEEYLFEKDYLIYYGDASGKNRSTNSIEHNYDVIRRVLHKYINDESNRVLRSNPRVAQSRAFINKILVGGFENIEIIISDKCKNLIKDLEFLKEAPDGGKLIERIKDERTGQTYEKYGHCSDALTYFLISAFNSYYEPD
jgi:hypothetical protein